MEGIKGYKVFNPDWTCRDFKYEVGNTYEEDVDPSICDEGFHFCKLPKDCFNYYSFDSNNKVAEVVALGEVAEEGDKCATNKIKIIREISWQEVLTLVNTGKNCTGHSNTGDWNSGHFNSGHWNSGHRNSGDWNQASQTVGCFNTHSQKLRFFDKETDITFLEWRRSNAFRLLNNIDFRPTDWISSHEMTDEEKAKHPEYKTTGGYLKIRDNTDCCVEWWSGLSDDDRNIIRSIPNFDAEKFYYITGIKA